MTDLNKLADNIIGRGLDNTLMILGANRDEISNLSEGEKEKLIDILETRKAARQYSNYYKIHKGDVLT